MEIPVERANPYVPGATSHAPTALSTSRDRERVGIAIRTRVTLLIFVAILATLTEVDRGAAGQPRNGQVVPAAHLPSIMIDYPLDGSIFPPEITPPTFMWRDTAGNTARWQIDIAFSDGSAGVHAQSAGERLAIGEIDQRCISATNELPKLTPEQAAAHTWIPSAGVWEAVKKHSVGGAAVVTISGFSEKDPKHAVSRGRVAFHTSKDAVGAPIFYRDVPLMPSETEKGIIKPLAPKAMPLIQWRLRNIGDLESRVVLKDMVTCANCHSFSGDGKTMGMDMDGPGNDKGLYAIVPVKPEMTINATDMVTWDPTHYRQVGLNRVGFMSQISPDGKYVVTTVTTADRTPQNNFYVVNFKDYRFLQVFYPTRGILAWYSRDTGRREPLPGADDPRYVQTDGVWSPDGSYLVFARAEAKEPYTPDGKMAAYANDPLEVQIQYDLYRVPFNGGKGGQPEAIAGASSNGMSNTFPKVSPDGRWIVFVKCRNGQLMRPDGQLYIVPTEGGQARRMLCNTPLMNSWHSFSPNGRWLVFSSKARSPYTQMYLTHLDEEGHDSPAILIENTTSANRAVNLPEFVNIPPDGLLSINVPATEFYWRFEQAWALAAKGQDEAAIAEWKEALKLDPEDAKAHNNLGVLLLRKGRLDEGIAHFQKALEVNPEYSDALNNLGIALLKEGKSEEAIKHLQKAVEVNPLRPQLYLSLGEAFYSLRNYPEAVAYWRQGLRVEPNNQPLLNQTAWVLATCPKASVRNGSEAVELAQREAQLSGGQDPAIRDTLAAAFAEVGRFPEAVQTARQALALATQQNKQSLAVDLKARIALYEANTPFREAEQPTASLAPRP
jgi:tetratricopeptide (TPR) repeat protein